ncbi:CAP domain-containing protein [Sorangium sp. So ce385]|uniref:CAP domain-containing protein n=1 Tax=Sorangium sp. So ce385 TaxID=3133308 RepID=UPI003F5C1347
MLNPSTHSYAIALAATFMASVLSGCIGELGSAPPEGEGDGPTSGAGIEDGSGPPGGGATAGSGGSAAAGAGDGGSAGGSPPGGSAGSTTAGPGGGGSTTAGAGGGAPAGGTGGSDGSTTAGAGGSGGAPAGGTGGSDGSTTAGAGGSGGAPAGGTGGAGGSGSGAGGNDDPTGAAQLCVDTINQHRATLGLPPLARWTEAESCSDEESESDGNTGQAHGAFGACDERAQNECPGWNGPPESMIVPCLQLMWDEGPGEDFNKHGHYINMSSTAYTKVACGFHTFPDGSVWAVQNFR